MLSGMAYMYFTCDTFRLIVSFPKALHFIPLRMPEFCLRVGKLEREFAKVAIDADGTENEL